MKKSQKALCIVGIIGISILGYSLFQRKKKPLLNKTAPEKPSSSSIHQTTQAQSRSTQKCTTIKEKPSEKQSVFPLQKGDRGKEIERLQIWLLRNHGWKGEITKVFDLQTLQLVRKSLKRDQVAQEIYQKYKMGTPIYQKTKH
ncbi:hypothetical protein [Aquimarina longa]|uniref:hypothetical protein n=1 Tax=Aquimarina longa TaxID=1080221 RepID=UPI00078106E9|nr:hypothetical protein [Aquimarina longa]